MDYHKSFEQTPQLTDACEMLRRTCNDFDGLHHPYFIDDEYVNFSDNPWLYYATDAGQIVGFLSLYPLDPSSSEFCLFVLPTYRRKRVATQLFSMMVADFPNTFFEVSTPPLNDFGKSFLTQMGFVYASTECSMKLEKSDFVPFQDTLSLTPQKQDAQIVVRASVDSFAVGRAVISASHQTVCIHDVEIAEKYRGKGYGYRLIGTLLNHIFEKYDTAILHVTKENIPAYRLYQKIGFACTEMLEYYEI